MLRSCHYDYDYVSRFEIAVSIRMSCRSQKLNNASATHGHPVVACPHSNRSRVHSVYTCCNDVSVNHLSHCNNSGQ